MLRQNNKGRGEFSAPFFLGIFLMATVLPATSSPIVIAHRGASGYLPEHTLEAKAMAHTMGADFLEQDVVLTRDGVPIVLHDIYLDSTTNVAQRFPERQREDGHYYAIDFDLSEIRELEAHERTRINEAGERVAVFPGRYPLQAGSMSIPSLAEEIAFIAGMDTSTGRTTGLYIELKAPNFHQREGHDIARAILQVLADSGYDKRPSQVFLQSFDDKVLRYLREDLDCQLPLIQLIADPGWGEDSGVDYTFLQTAKGLDYVASYAEGIGPWYRQIYLGTDEEGKASYSELVTMAQARDLKVHPYTLRREDLPAGIKDFDGLLAAMLLRAGVDGIFTDFPDLARTFIDAKVVQDPQ